MPYDYLQQNFFHQRKKNVFCRLSLLDPFKRKKVSDHGTRISNTKSHVCEMFELQTSFGI